MAILVLVALGPGHVNAGVVLVSHRSSLGGNDVIDWSPLGTHFQALPNPFNHASNGGLGVVVSQASGHTYTFDTGPSAAKWDFAVGDEVIETRGGGPLTITFATPVIAAGAQVQTPFFATVNAHVSAYDAAGVLLGTGVVDVPDADGVAPVTELGAPNGGDGNDDGIPDGSQGHVTSVPQGEGSSYVTL
ncbi:hypothetical protein ACFL59_14200 [Planctomycetota bacterium]